MQIHSKRRNTTQGWKEIAGRRIFFRSRWEYIYGAYLEFLKKNGAILEWEHEPKTFWFEGIKRGCVSYKPDFLVTNDDESTEWIEVKGYYDAKSLTKIKRFRKYFPQEKLTVVDSKWFKSNTSKLKIFLKDSSLDS